ncbi:hypothetical protein J4437_06135 [Candidatus Woesearchaeota archaeon]|nr:hypothetical protein [Candidatus Woesearchaeota archaeon]
MSEKTLIVDHLKLSYDGLFSSAELYNVVSSFFFEKGWDWVETLNQEMVTPQGKQIRMILEPYKSSSDFYKLTVRIHLNMNNVKDVEVEHDGKNVRLNQGAIYFTIDGFVVSDRKNMWKDKPWMWFFMIISQKYFFKNHFDKLATWLKSDVEDLHGRVKRYLHSIRYTYQS